jgi:hypothetical protein
MKSTNFICMTSVLALGISGCSKPIHLGSLNESGTPVEFLAGLQKVRVNGPADVKTQQVLESLSIGVGEDSFTVTNNSKFFIDQLSFSCEVVHNQFVYFTWDAGFAGGIGKSPIEWLLPGTKDRYLVQRNGEVTLLHNDIHNYENLGPNQVSWLLHKYHFSNCRALDISDATEDDPIKRRAMIDKCNATLEDSMFAAACVAEGDTKAKAEKAAKVGAQ